MKKVICILAIFVMIFGCALAEIDLSGMSFDELAELRDKALLAMWKSDEWQEVTVPQGTYTIGKEIPAGTWIIKCADVDRSSYMMDESYIEYGYEENGRIQYYASQGGDKFRVYNPNNRNYDAGSVTEVKVDLKEGMLFNIDTAYAPAVFTPDTGAPSFSFK